MKYSQIRVILLTFTIGITLVPFFNGLYEKWNQPLVDLPSVESTAVLFVNPRTGWDMQNGSSGNSGYSGDGYKILTHGSTTIAVRVGHRK